MEYVELRLCREYHCLPSQLRQERASDVIFMLHAMSVEHRVREARKKNHGQ